MGILGRNRGIILVGVIVVTIIGSALVFYSGLQSAQNGDALKIVTTFYPLSYFAVQLGGEKVQVSTLIPYNSEVHSWQPSISDITETEDSEVIIYLGAGLDHWMQDDILQSINIEGKTIVEASIGITMLKGVVEEKGEPPDELDPHLWVCPYTADQIAGNIYDALIKADPENTKYYTENWRHLHETFTGLDEMYETELQLAAGKTFFTTHSAYNYVADRYGLKQYGVIGLSADEQPSTAKIAEIVEKMTQDNSYVIYIDPVYSDQYAQTLKTELNARTGHNVEILKLYLMLGPLDDLDYVGQLEANLNNLKKGLLE